MNPFRFDKLVTPEEFCGREREIERLTSLISNKANVILYGDRRYGKTSLIHKVFADLPDTILPIYVDIYSAVDEMDFAKLLYDAVEKATPNSLRKQTGKLLEMMSHLEGVSFSPSRSGESFVLKPSFKTQDFSQLLESAFKLIDQYCKHSECTHAVIAFDEFQQIADIKKVKIDAMLRSISQSNDHVCFVFSGSKKSLLRELLSAPRQPWHGMTTPIALEGIEPELLRAYCEQKMGGSFDDHAFTWLYETLRGQTRLILQMCFDLLANNITSPSTDDVMNVVDMMLNAHNADFKEKFLMYSGTHKKALRAIASAPDGNLYDKENLLRHNINKKQGLNQTIQALMKADEIQKVGDGHYQFTNVLFGLWLVREQAK